MPPPAGGRSPGHVAHGFDADFATIPHRRRSIDDCAEPPVIAVRRQVIRVEPEVKHVVRPCDCLETPDRRVYDRVAPDAFDESARRPLEREEVHGGRDVRQPVLVDGRGDERGGVHRFRDDETSFRGALNRVGRVPR